MSLSLLHPAFQAAADTVVAVAARDPLSIAVDVAILLMALGVAILAVVGAAVVRRLDGQMRRMRRTLDVSLGPVSDRARSISDNVEFITDALRTDVQRLNASVKALTDRLHQASDRMEERVEEFNALMEVVQSEAEDIFLDTAATARGIREGARTIASGDARRARRGADEDPDGPAGEGEGTPPGTRADAGPGFVPGQEPGSEAPPVERDAPAERSPSAGNR